MNTDVRDTILGLIIEWKEGIITTEEAIDQILALFPKSKEEVEEENIEYNLSPQEFLEVQKRLKEIIFSSYNNKK